MKITISKIQVKNAINKSRIYGVQYCLNPYRGCQHACRYCYAELIIKKTGKNERWGSYVDIKDNFIDILGKEVHSAKKGIVMISSVTDPYQPIEARTCLTRKCLKVLADKNFPVYILTKSPLVLRDIDIFKSLEDCEVGITITTDNENIRKLFEPFAPPLESRISALQKLKKAGVKTSVFIGPVLPMKPEKLFGAIENFVDYIYIDKMNYSFKVKSIYERAGLKEFMHEDYFNNILNFFSSNFENVINCME
jgi:DNA repair photolyase